MTHETKAAITGVEIKDEIKGTVEVQFATYNEIDKHGDITKAGAFTDGAEVLVSGHNHAVWGGQPPVGKGVIRDTAVGPVGQLQYFMNTTAGREAFETVKATGSLQQWSYGFDVVESEPGESEGKSVRILKKMAVHEISPVTIGAGNSTRTLAVKRDFSQDQRNTDASNGHAMPDGSFPIDNKEDLSNAIHAVGRAKDPEKAKAHIIKRARALGLEDMLPKDWTSGKSDGKLRMSEEAEHTVAALKSFSDRVEELVTLRTTEGKKGMSDDTLAAVDSIIEMAEQLKTRRNAPDPADTAVELETLAAWFDATDGE